MGYNIGPKIGIEGEAAFRQQIKAINNEYKTLQAQTKALTAEFDKNGDQQGKLKMQTQQLEKQIENQKRAIEEMEKALKTAENTTDANSDAVTTWQGKLYNAQAAVSKLEKELQDNEDALRQMEEGIEDIGKTADDTGEEVSKFGDILKGNLVADAILDGLKKAVQLLKELGKNTVEAVSDLRAEAAQFQQTFGEMENAATDALKRLENQTGISATRIKGNFTTVYAFAKTMGADSEEALSIASRAMAAAADSAAYYNMTVEEATETLQAYIKGNYANDAALGIASTETTRNAKAMELYAKSFKELTEAQKVDTLLAMVEAGNKASGAMGQAARETAEWTNVTAELKDAQKQLLAVIGEPVLEEAIPIVQELTQGLREMAEVSPGKELRQNMKSFTDALEEAETAYQNTMAATLGTATVAERYVQQLEALEAQGLDTVEAHTEYESLVIRLNTIMPELNVAIDEQTGLINKNTQALRGDIEAWKEAATTSAMYDRLSSQLEAYGKAQMTLVEATEKRSQLMGQQERDLETLSNLLGVVGAAYVKVRTYSKGGIGSRDIYTVYDKTGKKLADFADDLITADTKTVELGKALVKTAQDLEGLDNEVSDAQITITEYAAEMDHVAKLMDEYKNGKDDTTEAEKAFQTAISETRAALKELEEAYAEAKETTRQMLESSIGLWDEMAKESDWTAEKVLENWRSQMKAFDQYSTNLQKAKGMGLSDGIIEALSDGSQQSMQILDAMVNQSEYSVGEINAAFTDLDLAKDATTDALMSLDKSFQEGYDKLVEDARAAGLEIVDSIVQAIEDNSYNVREAFLKSAAQFALDFRSSPQLAQMLISKEKTAQLLFSAAPTIGEIAGSMSSPSTVRAVQNFYITQQPGESAEELAQMVAEIIANDTQWKGDGLGG